MLKDSLGPQTVHLCIDMQNLLLPGGPWFVPWARAATQNILHILERTAPQTVFTRFIPPRAPDDVTGTWKEYYRHWREMTREVLHPHALDLIDPFRKYVPPAAIIDKGRYSAFFASALQQHLAEKRISTLVMTGAETDVCVLATLCHAVDLGYRIVMVRDAICSSSDKCHDALLTLYEERFTHQLEMADTGEVLDAWRE